MLTRSELSQYYWVGKEIKQLENQLIKLEGKEYKPINLTGMPRGSDISDLVGKLATDRAELYEMLSLKVRELMIARKRVERFINSVEQSEIRMILRYRHIDCLTWQRIAFKMGWHDEQIPRKKYNKYFEESTKSTKEMGYDEIVGL